MCLFQNNLKPRQFSIYFVYKNCIFRCLQMLGIHSNIYYVMWYWYNIDLIFICWCYMAAHRNLTILCYVYSQISMSNPVYYMWWILLTWLVIFMLCFYAKVNACASCFLFRLYIVIFRYVGLQGPILLPMDIQKLCICTFTM